MTACQGGWWFHRAVLVLFNCNRAWLINGFMSLAKATHMLFRRVLEVVMKSGFLKLVKNVVAPVALVVAMAAFSPVAALAADHGGGHGFSGGHGGFGGGHSFAAPSRGNFSGGHAFSAPTREFNGGVRGGREFYGGRAYYGGRGYYGPGFGVGVYAPYGYAAPVCNPAGFYDQYGVWQVYPGCAVPYGY
jgi:hypothetical protein